MEDGVLVLSERMSIIFAVFCGEIYNNLSWYHDFIWSAHEQHLLGYRYGVAIKAMERGERL